MSDEVEDLRRRIADLEADLKRLLKAQEPKPEFKPTRPYQPIDWAAGMKMPPSAAQEMARVVGDVKREPMTAEQVESSWARSRISGPSGFGPPNGDEAERREKQRRAEEAGKRATEAKKPPARSFAEEQVDRIAEYWVGGPNDCSKLK